MASISFLVVRHTLFRLDSCPVKMVNRSKLILAQFFLTLGAVFATEELIAEVNYNADDAAWTVIEGNVGGRLTWIRIQRGIEKADKDSLPRRLTIRWEYPDDGDRGMPPDGLQDPLRALEDALVAKLLADKSGVLSLVTTAAGAREWHVHFTQAGAIQTSVNAAFAELPKMPILLTSEDDPEWSKYSRIISAIAED